MSLLKKLFGGGNKPVEPAAADVVDYKGFSISATPMAESGQFRVCGVISKQFGDETKSHKFIRADVFSDRQAAIDATVRKAQLIIDQTGDAIF